MHKVAVIAFILMNLTAFCLFISQINGSSITITVPDDYATIQEAINHANAGATINVRNGTYNESVLVNKQLSLIGTSETPLGPKPVIDGNGAPIVVKITADNVFDDRLQCYRRRLR